MLESNTIKHSIDRDILEFLTTHEYARFSDMRPPKVDTNLFTYHLKLLVKNGYLTKTDEGYTLSEQGLSYIDRVTHDASLLRTQPKVVTMLLIQDGYGKVLLQRRAAQPYIDSWELPSGEARIDDQSVLAMARNLANEKLSYKPAKLRHVGDCYVVVGKKVRTNVHPGEGGVFIDGDVLHLATRETFETQSRTLIHVVRFESDDVAIDDRFMWAEPLDIARMKVAPGTEQIITRAFFGDSFFFEEFTIER
jgi:8-oxo-dGTP pyrophosphatase MutT (NUDIX family)